MATGDRLQFQPPNQFSFQPRDWPTWRKRFEHYRNLSKLSDEDEVRQVHALVYSMGEKADEILAAFKLSDADKEKYQVVMDAFEAHFFGKKNVIYERATFGMRNQEDDESVDTFVTALHTLSEHCEYGAIKEQLVRDRLILGVRDKKLSEKLMLESTLTLEKAVEIAKQWETVKQQRQDLRAEGTDAKMDRVGGLNNQAQGRKRNHRRKPPNKGDPKQRCPKCGYGKAHEGNCPASESECRNCGKIGHWAKVCQSSSKGVNNLEGKPTSFLGAIGTNSKDRQTRWTEVVQVDSAKVEFKLDPGADVTAIPLYEFRNKWKNTSLESTNLKLEGPDGTGLGTVGMFHAKMIHKNNEIWESVYVVRGLHRPLLGLRACEDLGLVKRMDAVQSLEFQSRILQQREMRIGTGLLSTVNPREEFPKLFQGLGKFDRDPYKIVLKNGSKSFAISTPRRVPIPLMEKVKEKLVDMVKEEVIEKVDEPTPWCAPMVIAPKADGDIRLCVDFSMLNRCVERELHPMPVVEHTLGQLAGAKIFSKLDANSGFYQIVLAEESTNLTTFMTPFGRYKFKRLPMGINSAPEHFQKRVAEVLEGIPGVVQLVDDILVHGSTIAEHDKRLREVLRRLQKAGITLCTKKCVFGVKRVSFTGHVIDENGIRPDPERVRAIVKLPAPEDKSGVRRILGIINFVGRFVPKLTDIVHPLNELLRDDVDFHWGPMQQQAFEELKRIVTSEPVLELYDPRKPIRVSADASSYGLGAVLLQKTKDGHWKPVSYASRSLTPTEKRYVQIEREALASTWACERFRDFLIGCHFEIETDHKPLLQILSTKDLEDLSPRLQRFRMRLMRFNYDMVYVPGKLLFTADALSRSPLDETGNAEDEADVEAQVHYVLANVSASDERIAEIWKCQQEDVTIQKLRKYCQTGWPSLNELDHDCKDYWSVKDELSIQEEIMMRGCRIVIPAKLQDEILGKIHSGHMGTVKCRARARESVWWPGISDQIAEMIRRCPVCVQERQNRHEPLIPSDFPERPWQKVGMDLFKHGGKWYLVLMDYYSRYPEVTELSSMTAAAVINRCKSFFARHGVPEEVRSDCGSQFKEKDHSEFRKFSNDYGFVHRTSSPRYPQSNGFAEAAVKTVKNLIKKNLEDPYKALLEYRATPLENGYSPAELIMGRKIRTTLPMDPKRLVPQLVDQGKLRSWEQHRIAKQKRNYDQHHRAQEKEDFRMGEMVWVVDLRTWGTIAKKLESPRSYLVNTARGQFRRNSYHLTKAYRDESEDDDVEISINVEDPQRPAAEPEPEQGGARQQNARPHRVAKPVVRLGYGDKFKQCNK